MEAIAKSLKNTMSTIRRYDLDWLRVIVILNLIPFHAAWLMVFVEGASQISKNTFGAKLLSLYVAQIAPIHMPLLFLIAGYSAAIALQTRSTGAYLEERLQRLLIPLVSYMLWLAPIQSYFAPAYEGDRTLIDFGFNFLPDFFTTIHNGAKGGPRWSHLWFLAYLLVMNLITVPLLLALNGSKLRKNLKNVIGSLSTSFGIFLPCLLFGGILATLGAIWPFFQGTTLYSDWAYFSYNLCAFWLGYIMCRDEQIVHAVYKKLRLWVILAIVSAAMRIGILAQFPDSYEAISHYGRYIVFSVISGVHTWSSIAAMLALAHQLFSYSNRFLTYCSNASFAYYVLHLPFLIIINHYIAPLNFGILVKFSAVVLLTLAATTLAYEFLVKPYSLLRLSLGVKAVR